MGRVEVCPSILSADFSNLERAIQAVERGGADQIHLDVMDGHFVPNISFGPPVIKSLRKVSTLPYWAHLMISAPEQYIDAFVKTGVDGIVVHAEVEQDAKELADQIHSHGIDAGLCLNPDTDVESYLDVLPCFERLLIMTVNPGFGGQSFMPGPLEKIQTVRKRFGDSLDIEVDGGVDVQTAGRVIAAGANMLVAGSAVFMAADPVAAVALIRSAGLEGLV